MLFSVIIPTCNRPEQLQACLDRLAPGTQWLDTAAYEVIVTDDGKDEVTAGLLAEKYSWVRYTRGPQRGPAANRNHGAKQTTGEWLVFTDDDCLPEAGWLEAYAQAVKENLDCRAFEGAVKPDRPRQSAREVAPINEHGGVFWSCNIAVSKSLFQKIEGFDEQFPYPHMEDIDLKLRILSLTEIVFVPLAIVIHPWRPLQAPSELIRHHESYIYFTHKWSQDPIRLFRYLKKIARARLTPVVVLKAWSESPAACYDLFKECLGVVWHFGGWQKKYR